ncbi:2,5-diketo-D-gluconic acid reductase [Carnobacterium divergens]|uniref:aldo/keto reductase n=1 Tax=Carnobacterium divergens TaxID=2748 RepID=UPI000D468E93|nr:aldo/keto reductase [Carnobacterium divergens]MCO6019247.1 aldo/keto reductase [Carnobacterium divergens]TFI63471.1 2,5-diketo-D-gluconic acid reductase [Carnobacterium divergens]TFI90431.1 2,5-diketo-D-gluconic acid reductase [Carnobacterium divergens]TFJ05152.1 2,5-diketo-D-gluconic acid reductase [Carnobacterium divergens]TFJ06774.1 2,5-diketo-D-gluconic acid reductase [Carnobacterium divergens]
MKKVTLANGVQVPIIGFGVYQIPKEKTAQAVEDAIKAGYRHIDTAQSYLNESEVGQGITASGIAREELFVTTKIWVHNVSYDGVMKSFDESLKRLNLEYVDLLLIHQPYNDVYGAWRAMEELQKSGKVRAIGISNFAVDRAIDLAAFNEIKPQINPFQQQTNTIKALREDGIAVEAWAPFAEGKRDIFKNPILTKIGQTYHKSVAQIILRWLIQQDIIVLAKSVNPDRMKENIDVFDFELTAEDINQIATLNDGESQFFSHADPAMIKWMVTREIEGI